jgi:hypothetical protein
MVNISKPLRSCAAYEHLERDRNSNLEDRSHARPCTHVRHSRLMIDVMVDSAAL